MRYLYFLVLVDMACVLDITYFSFLKKTLCNEIKTRCENNAAEEYCKFRRDRFERNIRYPGRKISKATGKLGNGIQQII